MLVKKILIFIIVIIILIELYLNFCMKPEEENNNFTNSELKEVKEIIIVDKQPWEKIKETKNGNFYYINILHFNEVKFIEWKEIIPDIEYDIHKKLLKIPSKDEERAISIVNLLISNMKGDIELDEILKNDLINKSIIKSRNFNVVFSKIKNLVIENNVKENDTKNNDNKLLLDDVNKNTKSIDTFKINDIISETKSNNKLETNNKPESNNKPETNNKVKSIKPEEYNYDGFKNSHYNLFKKDKLIRNSLTAGAYGGKQYARPYRN
jgi:hypothetical protein